MKTKRTGRLPVAAIAALVVFFVAAVGAIGFTLAYLGQRKPTQVTRTYDMPADQVTQFVKAASGKLKWEQHLPASLTFGTPTGELHVGVTEEKDHASVVVDGPRASVDALVQLLDNQLPASH